jgi:hypothetical protein
MDSQGRFNLLPGETMTLNPIPKDIQGLIKRGFLVELKDRKTPKKQESGAGAANAAPQKLAQANSKAKQG